MVRIRLDRTIALLPFALALACTDERSVAEPAEALVIGDWADQVLAKIVPGP